MVQPPQRPPVPPAVGGQQQPPQDLPLQSNYQQQQRPPVAGSQQQQQGSSKTISAPTSPAKSRESLLQRVSSLTSTVVDRTKQAIVTQQQSAQEQIQKLNYNKDRCFTLLVIDDQNTDWSKYFRGRRIQGDWDVRVEQAEFRELSITASSSPETGAVVSMAVFRNGTKVVRAFRPDFVLIRQNMRDAAEDYKSIILGLKFGGVPSINSLEAVYHFQDKPWVFGHMVELQRRFGKEHFPLIDQTFYPNHREMVSAPRLPAVLKIGHAHGGLGKLKVETALDFQDAASVVAVSNSYCTVEPYVDSKFDVHIQKIGNHYKAFMRKSISGNWKTNLGSAMLEQTPMTDKYRSWIEAVSSQFGGLDLCALEVLVARDGREIIMELNDCALPLLGDSQEEDRRLIAELVLQKMHGQCKPSGIMSNATSRQSLSRPVSPPPPAEVINTTDLNQQRRMSTSSATSEVVEPANNSTTQVGGGGVLGGGNPFLNRRQTEDGGGSMASAAGNMARSFFTRSASQQGQQEGNMTGAAPGGEVDGEDTMKNLRKTFAGIFGDM